MARTKATGTNPSTATTGKTVDDAMAAIERDWQMANAEVRIPNPGRSISTFETRTSKFV